MDLKIVYALAYRYIAPTIVVLLLLAGGMAYVWGEYRSLLKEKDQLTSERKSLNDERVLSEKNCADETIELIIKKAEIERREFILQQLESQNKEQLSTLQKRTTEYEAAFKNLQKEQSAVSQDQRLKEGENKIQKLMSEFSAMGVNLNDPIECGDSDTLAKFNAAKAKYLEISTLADAYGLAERFKSFLFHNNHMTHFACLK